MAPGYVFRPMSVGDLSMIQQLARNARGDALVGSDPTNNMRW